MTQPLLPASVPADGNLKVVSVPAIADPTAPTVTELTAVSVVDLSLYLTPEGFNPGTEEQTISDDRLASRQTFERPGRFQDSLEIAYVYNLKSPNDNKVYTALIHLTTGLVVARWGTAFEDPFAADDIVDVYPAQCGVQRKQPPTANGVLTVQQKIFITGPVQRDVTVVA